MSFRKSPCPRNIWFLQQKHKMWRKLESRSDFYYFNFLHILPLGLSSCPICLFLKTIWYEAEFKCIKHHKIKHNNTNLYHLKPQLCVMNRPRHKSLFTENSNMPLNRETCFSEMFAHNISPKKFKERSTSDTESWRQAIVFPLFSVNITKYTLYVYLCIIHCYLWNNRPTNHFSIPPKYKLVE